MSLHHHAQHPVKHEGADQPDQLGPGIERLHVVRRDIERQNHDCRIACGNSHAPQDRKVFDLIGAPRACPPGLELVGQFGLPFDRGQREEEEHRKAQQPGGKRHGSGHTAGDDPDRVKAGQGQHIDQKLALEQKRIGESGHQIGQKNPQKRQIPGQKPQDQRHRKQAYGHHATRRGREISGGKGAQALAGMGPVGGKIEQVVYHIDRRGGHAECQETQENRTQLRQVVRGQNGKKQQHVLGPLVRAHRLQHRLCAADGGIHVQDIGVRGPCGLAQAR